MSIHVVLEDLGPDLCGYYEHETRTVHINSALPLRERRTTLVHELIHAERAHEPVDNLAVHMAREVEVEHEAARRLISFPQLMWAVTYHGAGGGGTSALDVEPCVYIARILAMTRMEQIIFDVCALQCIGVKTEMALSAGEHPALLNTAYRVDGRILDASDYGEAA